MKNTYTNHFPLTTPPVNDGVYELSHSEHHGRYNSLWKDGQWHNVSAEHHVAATNYQRSQMVYEGVILNQWRGQTVKGAK